MFWLESRIYVVATWIGVATLVVSLLALALIQQWIGAIVVAPFLGASLAFVAFERRLPPLFDCLFVWTAVVNAAGYAWDLYATIPPYDEIVHGTTIFAITLTGGYLTYRSVAPAFARHRTLFMVAVTSFGIAVGALWEVFEWTFGFVGPIPDTMVDLILDSIGAAAAALLAGHALRRRVSTPPHETDGVGKPQDDRLP